jgi:hypothetical protein
MARTRKVAALAADRRLQSARGRDEDRTLARLRDVSDLIDPIVAMRNGRAAKRTTDGGRSKSHLMKALVLAALLLPPIGAAAVSPENAYLAARDRYIASFKTSGSAKDEKEAFARQDKAVGISISS